MRVVEVTRETDQVGTFTFYPIGDLHCDTVHFDEARFLRYVRAIATDPTAVAVFVGDAVDGRVPGRKHFEIDALRPSFRDNLRRYHNHALERCLDYLLPVVRSGCPLILFRGNHDIYLEEGDFVESVWKGLGPGAYYLADEGFARIRTGAPRRRRSAPMCYSTILYGQHGYGGGRRPGSKVNNLQSTYEWVEADIVVSGHVHDGDVRIVPAYTVASKGALALSERPRVMVRAPGFVRRAVEGATNYAGRKGYPSTDQGLIAVRYVPHHRTARRVEMDF